MESQPEEKFQEFDQEVDAVVGRKKRKMSESQLKALAEGRKKRWLLKKSSGIKFEPIVEAESGSEESEKNKEEVKSDTESSESEDDSGNETAASPSLSADNDSSDSDSGNYPTTDSDSGVDEKEEIPFQLQ